MIVTKINKKQKKYQIYIDNEYSFDLYLKEIKKYKILINQPISESVLLDIEKNVICKRGKNYVYHLISRKDYTYNELYKKLIKADYKEQYTQVILADIKSQGFIDDLNYTERYIEQMYIKKSKKEIIHNLQNKGIGLYIINKLYDGYFNEYDAANQLIHKKIKGRQLEELSYQEKSKLYNFLYRKGYKYETINKVLNDNN